VATGGLSPANIAAPLRAVLERHSNVEVLLAEVRGFDLVGLRVLLADDSIAYDSLIVATGSMLVRTGARQNGLAPRVARP